MEHYGAKRASAPDPKGLAAAAFDQLRATLPPDDEAWRRIDTALTEFIHEKERQTS
jgi:hypothetical protein